MKTLLLMSVVWVMFLFPAIASRRADPVKAVRQMVAWFALFCVAYYLYVAFGHPRFFIPHE